MSSSFHPSEFDNGNFRVSTFDALPRTELRTGPRARLRAWWAVRPRSERRSLIAGAAVIGLALLWWVGVGPALATLRSAPEQHRLLDAQLLSMRALAGQAASLQSLPRIRPEESARALESSIKQLPAATQLALTGDRATVTLKGVPGATLAAWLAQTRINARLLPQEARLRLNAARNGWDGTVVFVLPPA
jgi:general secretion pathway protein M